jgi:hypothetical protein
MRFPGAGNFRTERPAAKLLYSMTQLSKLQALFNQTIGMFH